ncbi:hypothetical protein Tco_0680033 [Tanacetum coccineum]|uniref:Reverse transcriptase domain-containing protein n=1 Tax=Tanacetum coccineum TaxID=301880 RepID=A0ABQ4XJF4_9ASTR
MPSQPSSLPPSRLPHHLHLHLVTINTIVTTSSLPSPSYTTTRVRVVLLNPKQGAFNYWHQQGLLSRRQLRFRLTSSSFDGWLLRIHILGIESAIVIPAVLTDEFEIKPTLIDFVSNNPFYGFEDMIDSLLEEFAGELAPINPIPPGIHEADFDPKEDIHLDDQMFYDYTSSDDDSFEDINYVEASPPDSKLVNIEEVEDDILRAKLSNIYLFIAKFESLNDNPTLSFLSHSDNSLPGIGTF